MTYAGYCSLTRPTHKLSPGHPRFCKIAVGAQWYVRNVDLHDDPNTEPTRKYLKNTSEPCFEKAARHNSPHRGGCQLHIHPVDGATPRELTYQSLRQRIITGKKMWPTSDIRDQSIYLYSENLD